MKVLKIFNGVVHSIEGVGYLHGRAYVIIDGHQDKSLKMYYRHERTWDDHMGNTYCGYYINVRLNSCTHRIYCDELNLFR